MSELREVFEMVTKQTEPDVDSWKEQQDRQRRTARNRKIGAIAAVAAVVSALVLVFALTRPSDEPIEPAHTGPGDGEPTLTPGLNPQDRIIVGLDGVTQGVVTGLPEDAFALSLSSDGTTIAFVTAVDGQNQIATIGIDGQGMRTLGPGTMPAISPDGQQIAFVRRGDIHVIATDGSGVRQLTTNPHKDEFPQWSPDGTTIVYDNFGNANANSGYSKTSVIMSIPVTGGSPKLLSLGREQESEPSYSPDGSQIAFRRHAEIWVMNADGSNAHFLVGNTVATVDVPRWSPTGDKIAFIDYTDAWRANLELGATSCDCPILLVRVLDLASGNVEKVGNLGMATFWNAPQWMPTGHTLLLNVVRRD